MIEYKISVAMCTFNGESYLYDQLKSILDQTRQPDELVICDDLSSDLTVEIINDFKCKVYFPVRLFINESNLGSTQNFEKAISLCSGDLIALADQDDIWDTDKLKIIEKQFVTNPKVDMVFTDAEIVDSSANSLGYRLWQNIGFNQKEQKRFLQTSSPNLLNFLLRKSVVTGATICFKSALRSLILPIPKIWVHDAWISIVLVINQSTILPISDMLIKYRQHSSQQIGVQKKDLRLKFINASKLKSRCLDERRYEVAFMHLSKRNSNKRYSEVLLYKLNHSKARSSISNCDVNLIHRFSLVFLELFKGNYHRYSNGFYSIFDDACALVSNRSKSSNHDN